MTCGTLSRFVLLGIGLASAIPAPASGESPEQMAEEVLELLQEARVEAGVGRLEHREALAEVARFRARLVASLPHERRLTVKRSIGEDVQAAAAEPFLRVKLHLDLSRGARYPASAFFRNWQRYEAWSSTALDPDFDAIGLGVARGEDGWMVLAAVFFQDMPVPDDLPALERETIAEVNAVRRDLGLGELTPREWLSDVARNHSRDMADRDYVAHRSPAGTKPADRVRAAGGKFRRVAENIFMGSAMFDPAARAVESWMDSRDHRKSIVNPAFRETGLGVAVDDRGRVYFTQLFFTPAD